MERRFLALWLPLLAFDRYARDESAAAGPRAVVVRDGGTLRLRAVDTRARALGLGPGLGLADARARVPGLVALPDDPAADRAFLDRLARWTERYTPDVAIDGADGLLLDITGAAHLHGGEPGLRQDLLARLERSRVAGRAAIAGTAAAAWALSRFAPAAGAIVASGGEARALDPLPPAALRLDPEPLGQLARLGIRSIGALRRLPRHGLAARFGDGVNQRLDAAFGHRPEPISPQPPAPDWTVRRAFAEPISTPEDIARLAADMIGALCRRLQAADKGARALDLRCRRIDGQIEACAIATAAPVAEPGRLVRLFAEKLRHLRPGLGLESATLAAMRVEDLAPAQASLGADPGSEPDEEGRALAPLVDTLANRLGAAAVGRLVPVARHPPEAAQATRAASGAPGPGLAEMPAAWRSPWTQAAARPLRLLETPAPIEVTAAVPDGPPLQFRHRGRLHRVRRADGPERIAPEWWRAPADDGDDRPRAWLRDYYRIEDSEGRRFWVFRRVAQGEDAVAGASLGWFLHGIFA
jgi:protein ImuB